jgi:hypothetical protein
MRFPKAPAVAHTAAPIAMQTTVAVGDDYRIAVWDADLPGGALPKGALGALGDPKMGGTGTLTAVHPTEIAGVTAYVGTFTANHATPRRVAVFVHGGHLFVIRVQSEAAGTVFDAAAHSFHFTG